jgi:hypothetical protein
MSKGHGRVALALDALFDAEPDNAFTLEELCERAYPGVNRIQKKHRVSVARAAHKLADRRPEIRRFRTEGLGRALVFFRHDRVLSYAMARLKTDFLNSYRSKDRRTPPHQRKDEDDLRRILTEQDRHLIAPGGAWWRHVQVFLAVATNDPEKLARLQAEEQANLAQVSAPLHRAARGYGILPARGRPRRRDDPACDEP